MPRPIDRTVSLYLSLRQSRAIYGLLAVLGVLAALYSVSFSVLLMGALINGHTTLTLDVGVQFLMSVVLVGLTIMFTLAAIESSRRIRRLNDNPQADVKPMALGYLLSVFFPIR
ncbi:MAG: hypothetical protein AAFZ58_05555 [Pseudomonadota bacterium]